MLCSGSTVWACMALVSAVIDHCPQFQTIWLQLRKFALNVFLQHASKPSRTTEGAHCILFTYDFMPNHTQYGHLAISSETL